MKISPTIGIVDYGVGNLHSAVKAFKQFSDKVIVTEDADDIRAADALVLPGVGAFPTGMQGLKIRGLVEPIRAFSKTGKPMLGICLGAQIMLSKGYEFGMHEGLNLVEGEVVDFSALATGTKIPQIGWNSLAEPAQEVWQNTILDSVASNRDSVYFVHSFIFQPRQPDEALATTEYGGREFCSVFKKNNIYGCQFHPEKSGAVGLKIIENFIHLVS